jgi:Holliday junction resolvasome RuvABC endonuclease subunit
MGAFHVWLEGFLAVNQVDAIAWERPWLRPGDKADKMQILMGLPAIAAGFAGARNLPWLQVTPQDAKKTLTNKRNADKTEMIAGAFALGWRPATEHEADAGAVALAAYRQIWPRPRPGPAQLAMALP